MTQITLTLPESIVAQLERQVKQRNMSLDEFAFKLFSDALMAELANVSPSPESHFEPLPALEALIAKIKATPPNPTMIIAPTQTLAEVVAYWQAHPVEESDIAPDEWDRL